MTASAWYSSRRMQMFDTERELRLAIRLAHSRPESKGRRTRVLNLRSQLSALRAEVGV